MFFKDVLQEVYFGKQPELLEIEKMIGVARSKYMGQKYLATTKINSSNELYEINRAFEKLFGFKVFALHIVPSTVHNAYTYPISMAIDIGPQFRVKKNLLASSKGFKYKKEANYCCTVFVFSGLFLNEKFTDAEITAIILHEIGHNFHSVINNTIYCFNDITMVLRYISAFLAALLTADPVGMIANTAGSLVASSNIYKLINSKLTEILYRTPGISIVYGMIETLNGIIVDLYGNSMYLINLIIKYGAVPNVVLSGIISKVLNPLGKTQENVADSFATAYGYGAEVGTAITKLDYYGSGLQVEKALYSIPVFGNIVSYYNLPFEILVTAFDEHPTALDRLNVMRGNLKRELDKADLDPVLRAKLKGDLRDMDDALEEYDKLARNNSDAKSYKLAFFQSFHTQDNDKVSRKVSSDMDRIFTDIKLK